MLRKNLFLIMFFVALLLLAGCGKKAGESAAAPAAVSEPEETAVAETPEPTAVPQAEYVISDPLLKADSSVKDNNRVFYEIFVGSFSDSNGDGIGDLRGIINRMDYLNDGDPDSGKSLGVEGLWLTPIFESPSYHKYDVQDYYKVDPEFGSEADLAELIELCHARDVLVILDLPINHTSNFNQWFGAFRSAHRSGATGDPYYDFYTWYDGETEGAPAGRTFTQVSGTNHYVECNFSGSMPELNFDSDAVRQEVLNVAAHYLALGVDGFRFDAAKYVYFGEHKENQDFWLWYLDKLRELKSDVYTVAEVWDGDGITDIYYPATNCFNFTVSQSSGLIAETANKGDVNRYASYVESYLNKIHSLREDAAYVPFIANHDTDRAAGYLTVASGSMQMAANLYILGPGSPFIYYGEELGMRGSRGGANTDANRRLAMLWGDGDKVTDPTGTTYDKKNQIETTAVDQMQKSLSLYNYYKKLLMVRKANPEIARGTYTALKNPSSKVGGFASTYQEKTVLILHNTTMSAKEVDLAAITNFVPDSLVAVIGLEEASLNGSVLTIGSQTSVVIRCK